MVATVVMSVRLNGTLVIDNDVLIILSTKDGGRTVDLAAFPSNPGDMSTRDRLRSGLFPVTITADDLQEAIGLLSANPPQQ